MAEQESQSRERLFPVLHLWVEGLFSGKCLHGGHTPTLGHGMNDHYPGNRSWGQRAVHNQTTDLRVEPPEHDCDNEPEKALSKYNSPCSFSV